MLAALFHIRWLADNRLLFFLLKDLDHFSRQENLKNKTWFALAFEFKGGICQSAMPCSSL